MQRPKSFLFSRVLMASLLSVGSLMVPAHASDSNGIAQHCQSIGKAWTQANCTELPEQRRCIALEIAYQESADCVDAAPYTNCQSVSCLPNQRVAFGALEHYFEPPPERGLSSYLDLIATGEYCTDACIDGWFKDDISLHCCYALCEEGWDSGGQTPITRTCPD